MTKVCNRCKLELSLDNFHTDKHCKDGRYSLCKSCKKATTDRWRSNNREKYNTTMREYAKKNYHWLRLLRYKITYEQYQQMLKDQNGLCKICNKKTGDKKLVVDHCHKTGKTRALLCRKCNTLISLIDNEELHLKAQAYINSYK